MTITPDFHQLCGMAATSSSASSSFSVQTQHRRVASCMPCVRSNNACRPNIENMNTPTSRNETSQSVTRHVSMACPKPDEHTMAMVHFVFAVCFAATAVAVLSSIGIGFSSPKMCPPDPGYSPCAAWQDIRSVLSFVLGALLCCILTELSNKQSTTSGNSNVDCQEKVQLYTYML